MKQNLIRFAVALAAIQSKFVHIQSICPVTFNATCASVNKGSASYVFKIMRLACALAELFLKSTQKMKKFLLLKSQSNVTVKDWFNFF